MTQTTLQEKKDFIRAKSIEANPSILDLVFGCLLRTKTDTSEYILTYVGENNNQHALKVRGSGALIFVKEIGKDTEIIGRDIRLADVMYMLEEVGFSDLIDFKVFEDGTARMAVVNSTDDICLWNLLNDSLDLQSEPMIDYLYSLLNK